MAQSLQPGGQVMELTSRGISMRRQAELPIFYKDQQLHTSYRADFICYDSVIIELKALTKLSGTEEAQILNHLKASGHEIGLLLNFGTRSLEYKRFIWSHPRPQITPITQIKQ